MSGVTRSSERDHSLDFKGFLKDLNDSDYLISGKDQKMEDKPTVSKKQGSLRSGGKLDEDNGPPKKVAASESKKKAGPSGISSGFFNYSGAPNQFPMSLQSDEKLPDAVSEKELGNEYFKQKNYNEAIECYSRSIVLAPTSVVFANRAMAYIKIRRFEEAENDCTEALNLDDRYVKAYARRATARKELGKFRAAMEDAEFACRLEPNNQEVRKQYTEAKELLAKEASKKSSSTLNSAKDAHAVSNDAPAMAATSIHTSSLNGKEKASSKPLITISDVSSRNTSTSGVTRESKNGLNGSMSSAEGNKKARNGVYHQKQDMTASMQDVAARAASRVMAVGPKNISTPKSAYEFEVSWRTLAGDHEKQAQLLKTIPPCSLPQIFKNALSAPMLIEIIKCTTTIFDEDTAFAVSILENLTKVPRFEMLVMCMSAVYHAEIGRIWEQVFSTKDIQADHIDRLRRLQPMFCYALG